MSTGLIRTGPIDEVSAHHAFCTGEIVVALKTIRNCLIAQDADISLPICQVMTRLIGYIEAGLAVIGVVRAGAQRIAGNAEEVL